MTSKSDRNNEAKQQYDWELLSKALTKRIADEIKNVGTNVGDKIEGASKQLNELNQLSEINKNLELIIAAVNVQANTLKEFKDEVKQLRLDQKQRADYLSVEKPSASGNNPNVVPRHSGVVNQQSGNQQDKEGGWVRSQAKFPKVKVLLTDDGVKLTIPTPSVATRLQEAAKDRKLEIEYVQSKADAAILITSYTTRPQETEVSKKLSTLSGDLKVALYLQLSKDTTKLAAPLTQLTSETGLHLFHFIGTVDGLHPNSTYQQEQEDALIKLLAKFAHPQ